MFGVNRLCLLFYSFEACTPEPGKMVGIWKCESPSSNYSPTSESTERHEELMNTFPVVETKRAVWEAGEKGIYDPFPFLKVLVLMIPFSWSLSLWELQLPHVTSRKPDSRHLCSTPCSQPISRPPTSSICWSFKWTRTRMLRRLCLLLFHLGFFPLKVSTPF